MSFLGQSKQDEFVIKMLNYKKEGCFLEIGSNHPVNINNTYILEKEYLWNGLLVEYDKNYEELYKLHRNCNYIIQDATTIDYEDLLLKYNFPKQIDYLQIDLEVSNNSTLKTLELLDNTIMKKYTFNVVTFEHDIYSGDYFDTRNNSRKIFENNNYILLFGDVKNGGNPYEDWYVHSSFPNLELLNKIISLKDNNSLEYEEIIQIINNNLY
jgi:hypothetical protein